MAWTGRVVSVEKVLGGEVRVTIQYTDGVSTVDETYRHWGQPPSEWVEQTVAQKITMLEGATATTIPVGAVSLPTPPDAEKVAWLKALRKAERVGRLVEMGVVLPTTQSWTDLIAVVRAGIVTYWDEF